MGIYKNCKINGSIKATIKIKTIKIKYGIERILKIIYKKKNTSRAQVKYTSRDLLIK